MKLRAAQIPEGRGSNFTTLFNFSVKILAVLTCVFLCPIGILQADPDFTHPKSHLGSSDKDGCLYLWYDLATVNLKDGTKLPLRLRFATGPKLSTPLLGRFWWCPLLESTLLLTREDLIEFTTLGGRRIALRGTKDGDFVSGDGRYKARVASPSETVLLGDGWEYRFVSGKLKRAKHDSGTELEWVYQGTKLMSLNDKAGGQLLSLEYSGNQPLPTALVNGKTRYAISSQQVPIATDVMGQTVVAGYAPSMSEMKSDTMLIQFPITLEKDGKYQMDCRIDGGDPLTYIWRASDGVLESDYEWKYQASKTENEIPLVSRINKAGREESYFYDRQTGISESRLQSGEIITRQYFTASGPTQNKIRKLVRTKDGTEVESWQWSYDEMGRKIRERSGDFERSWEWRPDNTLVTFVEKVGDKILEKKLYNEEGKITERTKGAFSYRYSYEGTTAVVTQQFLDGKLLATKVSDLKNNQQFFLSEGPGGDPAEGAISALAPVPPGALEKAKNIAIQALRTVK